MKYLAAIFLVATFLADDVRSQPGGESCATATVVPGVPFMAVGQMGLVEDCLGLPMRDVFYVFTPTVTGQYTAGTCGSFSDTYLRVWTGGVCCAGASLSDDNGCGDDGQLTTLLIAGVPAYFEMGYVVGGAPGGAVFTLTGSLPPPCSGTLQLSATDLSYAPIHVGASSSQQVTVTNASGSSDLCVNRIRTNGSIWTVTPDSFLLAPGSQQIIQITFAPTFAHDFLGTVEIFTSDPSLPLDSILLEGTACLEVVTPPQPVLRDANAPGAAYFEPPYHPDNSDQEYAIEMVGSGQWVNYPAGVSDVPVWALSHEWGIESGCCLSGLAPGMPFQIRFHARDCTGQQATGPIAIGMSPPEIVLDDFDLTVKVLNDSTLQLSWNGMCPDTGGAPVANHGWRVLRSGNAQDSLTHWLTLDPLDSAYTFSYQQDREFYAIEPIPLDHWLGPRPFISWPPAGARVAGWQEIILKDALHKSEWDSFRIEADSNGTSILLGSSDGNTTSLMQQFGTFSNLSRLGSGARIITASIVDHSGDTYAPAVTVYPVEMPYANFTATYDSLDQIFTLTETGTVIPGGSAQVSTLWRFSHVGERYGPVVRVPWSPDFDSLMIVFADPQVNNPPLYTDDIPQMNPEENGGLQPETQQTPVEWRYIACCCVDMILSYSADPSDGNYSKSGYKGKRGPLMTCDANGNFEIGLAFEVQVNYEWRFAPAPGSCTCGQDAKGTRVISTGKCSNENHACTVTKVDTVCKFNEARPRIRYCYSASPDTGFGNDGFGPADMLGQTEGRNRGPRDAAGMKGGRERARKEGKASGNTRWYDPAMEKGKLGVNECIRVEAQNMFFARADPSCDSEMPCCIMWETSWDVTICRSEDGCHVAPGPAPVLTPLTPPAGGCPALKP